MYLETQKYKIMHLKPSLDLLTLTHFISLTAKPQTNLGGVVWGHIAQYTQLVSHLNRVLKIVSINSVRNISQLNFQGKSLLYLRLNFIVK